MIPVFHPLKFAVALTLVVAASSCSSSKKTKKSEFGPTYRERMSSVDKIMKHNDFSQRSSFEKQIVDAEKSSGMKTGPFKTNEFNGAKSFTGTKGDYKAKDFAQSGKVTNAGDKSFSGADSKNRMAGETFATRDNRMAGQSNASADKSFAQGGRTFATRDQREAAKSDKENKKPTIIDAGRPTYSEDQVRSVLNKN